MPRRTTHSGTGDLGDAGFDPRRLGRIQHVCLEGAPEAFVYLPTCVTAAAPTLVAIHGISRDARQQIDAFAPLAESAGWVLVAPRFDAEGFPDYQRLGRRGRGPRSDLALEHLLSHLQATLGMANRGLLLFGYSGGAQFVHRFLMAHPHRVQAAVAAGAGWYTFPDASLRYPQGIRLADELPGLRFHPHRFLRVPLLVVVGDADSERDESLRTSRRIDRRQGRTRVERAARFSQAMADAAGPLELPPLCTHERLAGVRHSFEQSVSAGLTRLTGAFLAEALQREPADDDEADQERSR